MIQSNLYQQQEKIREEKREKEKKEGRNKYSYRYPYSATPPKEPECCLIM